MKKIVAYIAHPIGGDVAANMAKLQTIVREINMRKPHVVPFVPYAMDVMTTDDNIPDERQRGIDNTIELFNRAFMDELWLYGDRITRGMADEIVLAHRLNIPVKPQTRETFIEYCQRWGDGDMDGPVMRVVVNDEPDELLDLVGAQPDHVDRVRDLFIKKMLIYGETWIVNDVQLLNVEQMDALVNKLKSKRKQQQ
jgi:hypothetical protein